MVRRPKEEIKLNVLQLPRTTRMSPADIMTPMAANTWTPKDRTPRRFGNTVSFSRT